MKENYLTIKLYRCPGSKRAASAVCHACSAGRVPGKIDEEKLCGRRELLLW